MIKPLFTCSMLLCGVWVDAQTGNYVLSVVTQSSFDKACLSMQTVAKKDGCRDGK